MEVADQHKKKILIVDDEPENLRIIADAFKDAELPYLVTKATNGIIALKLIEKEPPDLIICDWEMPKMNGIELITSLKKCNRTSCIPVIMCTGIMTSSENLKTALDAGAIDYIRKPIDILELIARTHSSLMLAESKNREIQKNKELEKLNSTKDKLFSIISHDLRSPFNAILGFSRLIINELKAKNYEQAEEFTKIIHKSAESTYGLLNNLLQWAKIQRRQITFNPEIIQLKDFIESILLIYEIQITNKHINLESSVNESIQVYVDPFMFETIFRNLISNAIKFTKKNGKIAISTTKNENCLLLSISDTGVGIKPEKIDSLFSIESAVSEIGTDGEKGSGLGLILCKEFIEWHNGNIQVESVLKQGTTFTISIPYRFPGSRP